MTAADSSRVTSRRGVLAATLGTIGAVVAASLGRANEALAANGDAIKVGGSFTGTSPTTIEDTSTADNKHGLVGRAHGAKAAGVRGDNVGGGEGILGTSTTGTAVHAKSSAGKAIVAESSSAGFAVEATSGSPLPTVWATNTASGTGVAGVSADGAGVVGSTGGSTPGVVGQSIAGPGVAGTTGNFVDYTNLPRAGVYGTSAGHVGGYFSSDTGTALKVKGKVVLSRSGRFQCSAGVTSKLIQVKGVTSQSVVLANIQQNRPGVYIRAVVPGTDEFTLYFNTAPAQDTVIGYLVLN